MSKGSSMDSRALSLMSSRHIVPGLSAWLSLHAFSRSRRDVSHVNFAYACLRNVIRR